MKHFRTKRSSSFEDAFEKFKTLSLHLAKINDFVNAVHCRLPFTVTFPTLHTVLISFEHCGEEKTLYLPLEDFEDIIGYSLMHIDDVL